MFKVYINAKNSEDAEDMFFDAPEDFMMDATIYSIKEIKDEDE